MTRAAAASRILQVIGWADCIRLARSQAEPVTKGIILVHEKRMLACNPGAAFDFGHERRQVTNQRPPEGASAKQRASQTLVHERLVVREKSHRVEHGHDGGRSRTAWRAIHRSARD